MQNGTLQETPFFRLLALLHASAATGNLRLKRGPTEKAIAFADGDIAHVESNLMPETLGKFLVQRGTITAEQEQSCLVRAMDGQRTFAQCLLEAKVLDAATLSQATRDNLRAKVTECFGWSEGEFAFTPDRTAAESGAGYRLDFARAVLDGCATLGPDAYAGAAFLKGEKKIKATLPVGADPKRLELTVNEVAVLKQLAKPLFLGEIVEKTRIPSDEVARTVLGFLTAGYAREVSPNEELTLDELVGMALLQKLQPTPVAPAIATVDPGTQAIANEVAALHFKLADLDHFALLGVDPDAGFVRIRDAFVAFATKFNPGRFAAPEVRAFAPQAEEVFLRGAKAFALLSDADQRTKYLDKLKAAQASPDAKKKPGEAFKIQTQLLDAPSQFEKGLNYLKTKSYAQAVEFFQHACDIDPARPEYAAHLAWCKFRLSPERSRADVEAIFARCLRARADSATIEYLYGKFLAETGRPKDAIAHLKKATTLDSKNPDYVRELRRVEATK